MRRLLSPTMTIAITGFALGLAYRYFADDPSEGSVVNYLRRGLHGMGIAATGWGAHVYFNSRSGGWLRRWPLAAEIILI